jgi:membrane protease YdiL (CAAX protease family)
MTDSSATHPRWRVASVISSHPTAAFFVLAVAISWGMWIPLFLAIPSATSVVMMPGAFGPALAAVVVLWAQGESVREWLADGLDWRISKRWYAVALGLPLGLALVLGGGLVISTGRFTTDRLPLAAAMYPVMVLVTSLLGGGQEEFGWRGFALPALQERYDALTASGIIGLVWAVWHLPAFAFEVPGYTGSFVLYALLVVGISTVLTWLYNSTDGSILLAMIFHGGVNAAPGIGTVFVGDISAVDVSPYLILVPAVWIVALLLLLRYGRDTLSADPGTKSPIQESRTGTTDASQ